MPNLNSYNTLFTHATVGGNTGTAGYDHQGLYLVSEWNTTVYGGHTTSNPFAMETGSIIDLPTPALTSNTSGSETVGPDLSYYRIIALDLTVLETELGGCPRISLLVKIKAFSKNTHSHIVNITSIIFWK